MKIIPDSSFFICFLGDLQGFIEESIRIDYLKRFSDYFTIEVTPIVYAETNKKCNTTPIDDSITLLEINSFITKNGPILQYLRPIFGRGEYEVISVAFSYCTGYYTEFFAILDDSKARKIVIEYISELEKHVMGTIGLIGYCNCDISIFSYDEAIYLLNQIKDSVFRIENKIVDEMIQKIETGGKKWLD